VGSLWRPATATAIMWVASITLKGQLPSSQGAAAQVMCLLLLVVSGIVVYSTTIFSLWKLSGKPSGAERFVVDRLMCLPIISNQLNRIAVCNTPRNY
jgi:hypothetical protein